MVEAPTEEVADKVARAAERYLKDLARQWLGRELPDWAEPCPIQVTLGSRGSRGSSTFTFRDGRVARQEMQLEGALERILDGVLPHEMTHVVLTQHFGRPFPRWADEGGAALAEGEMQTTHYRAQMQRLLSTPERRMPLPDLFGLDGYPRDTLTFYEMGYSVSNYLVGLKGRRIFLEFVAAGMDNDWDRAARRCYGFEGVQALERAWVVSVQKDGQALRAEEGRREQLPPPSTAGLTRDQQAVAK